MVNEEVRGGVLEDDWWRLGFDVKLYACSIEFMVQVKITIAATYDDVK